MKNPNMLYFWFFDTARLTNQSPIVYVRDDMQAVMAYRYREGKSNRDHAAGMYTDQAFKKLHTDYASKNDGGWRSISKCAWKKLFRARYGFSPEMP